MQCSPASSSRTSRSRSFTVRLVALLLALCAVAASARSGVYDVRIIVCRVH